MTITCVIDSMLASTAAAAAAPEKDKGTGEGQQQPAAKLATSFPAGLRVLLVDDDPVCLMVIGQMLRACQYEVCTCSAAASALDQLRDKSHNFDLVLSDVYMPDMDGFKLLEIVGLELGLPVIMMSANDEHSTVMRGVTHGACDFLIKPVRIEELKNIWQHVVRRSRHHATVARDAESDEAPGDQDADSSRKRNVHSRDGSCNEGQAREEEGAANKKPRVVWSVEMHQQFVQAVNQLGIDKAVPKKILELMKVDGLTRENVASHLQKYRLYLKRVQQSVPQPRAGSNGGSAAAAAAAGNASAGFAAAAGMGLPGMVGPNQMMWGNKKQLMDAMQAQQQAAAVTVQQQAAAGGQAALMQQAAAAAGQQQQQPPGQLQPQMGVMGAADGGMGGLLGLMPGGGLMSPMGQMMPGLGMGMGGMPGLPGMGGMPGLGSAAAAGGMMGLPGMPGFGAAMMGLMPGMAGLPGAMQGMGMAGAMNPLGQMPGMRPGMPGDPASVMAMMSMYQAQQQAAAAAAATNMPTNSGGGNSGAAILSPHSQQQTLSPQQQQQQQQSGAAAAAATAGLPTPTAAAVMPVPVPGLAGVSLKQEPNPAMVAGASQVPGMPGAAMAAGMQQPAAAAAAMAQAAAGMQPQGTAAAAQQSAALPGAPPLPRPPAAVSPVGAISGSEFRHVFDDVFDVHTATEPAATAAAAAGRGADQEFLDFILKG